MKIIVVGAGGHARSVCAVLLDAGEHEIVGLLDPDATEGFFGIPLLGGDELMPSLLSAGEAQGAFIAVGSNRIRRKLFERAAGLGYQMVSAISPHAHISRLAIIGSGVACMPGAVVHANASLGDGCILNTNASLDHDVRIAPFCHIAPGVAISGSVSVGEGSFIGVGARIIDKITLGAGVMLGAGAVAIRDLPARCTAVGVPAKIIKEESGL